MINRCNFVHNSNNRTVKTIFGDTLYYQNENWKKNKNRQTLQSRIYTIASLFLTLFYSLRMSKPRIETEIVLLLVLYCYFMILWCIHVKVSYHFNLSNYILNLD